MSKSKAGIVGAILALLFGIIVFLLGLVQPEYNHLRDTVSMLAVGKWGWIQQANFVLLILSMLVIAFGLKDDIWKYSESKKSLLIFFGLCIIAVVMALLFPSDGNLDGHRNFNNLSLIGKIHLIAAGGLLIGMGGFFYQVAEAMRRSSWLKRLLPLTLYVLCFNMIFGIIWFGFNEMGILIGYLGLFQKILVANVLVWLIAVGVKLAKKEN